ncbi:hypothetical protein [Neisseria meningitidis]|uniref:hypothetical protein n=1 Tax=Neisseria meningitidis TaxID=487 RepID=UPI001E4C3E98|nr:hypothetical protein [Neisseria meningitidis]
MKILNSFSITLNHTVLINIYLSNESYPTYVYEFDEIGVQAWEAKGKIVTIIAGGKDNYSTEPYYDE